MKLFLPSSTLILCILCTEIRGQVLQRNEGLNQQVHSKVERINLKDYGFDRGVRIDRIDRKDDKYIPRDLVDGHISSDTTNMRRDWRNRRPTGNNRLNSRRDLPVFKPENRMSSPLDWTTSPSRIGLAPDQDQSSRRAFDFSSGNRKPLPGNIYQKKNCSQECVPQKYLQHYQAKSCKPIMDHECNCALAFYCTSTTNKNSTVCEYEGRIYQIGSRIPVRNPCRICECRDFGRRRGEPLAEIDCGIGIECPESAFGLRPEPNCYFAYERDQCCGHQVCANTLIPKREQKTCRYKNRQYKLGQKIYPEEDNCKMCLCNDEWDDNNPLSSNGCQTYSCEFQLNKDFQNGCLPIYHEGTCCPIEYKCPKTFSITGEKSDQNNCLFDGRKYPIGSRLVTENVCVDCVCKVPPDFTCIHKSCPAPPQNCYVGKWDHSVCCQKYVCSRPDHIRDESQFRENFYSNSNK